MKEKIPLLAEKRKKCGSCFVSDKNIKCYNIKEIDVNTTYDYLFLEGYDNSLNNNVKMFI